MRVFLAATALVAVMAGAAVPALADSHNNNWNQNNNNWNHNSNYTNNNNHWSNQSQWHNGGHVSSNDWNRGSRVDWQAHHLRRPPPGYEWRQVDGRYVMAAVATGIIASIILASH